MLKLNVATLVCHALLLLTVLLSVACGTTQPSRFYMLTSITDQQSVPASHEETGKHRIGLGPVTLPKYLDRSPIVLRDTGSEVIIDDLHRWAEPLEDNFIRVLAENIYSLTGGSQISLHPWRNRSDIDYQITMTVYRFDTDTRGHVVMSSNWSINNAADDKNLYTQKSVINVDAAGTDYPALVKAQSKATEMLCREIVAKMTTIIDQGN